MATVTLNEGGGFEESNCMEIEYDDSCEVYGLLPVPINCEVRTDGANRFIFKAKIPSDNTEADLFVKLIAADGTSYTHTFVDAIPGTGGWQDFSFTVSTSTFPGWRYVRAVVFGITLA